MNATTDCMACVFRQALAAIRHASGDERLQQRVLRAVIKAYAARPLKGNPADYSQLVYETVKKAAGVDDPYAAEKKRFNKLALSMMPECTRALARSKDPLETAAHLAVAGNIIDLGIGDRLDIHGTLGNALRIPFAANDLPKLRRALAKASTLFYIGDNAGEIVFDRLFIETIARLHPRISITFAVKSGPVINDATMADARSVGMTKVCRVMEIGGAWVGAPLDRVSGEFRALYDAADVIIAKGQGNFETLDAERDHNIFFILKAKCEVVARALGVRFGDSVLKHVRTRKGGKG
ncbi:DUF89 family protein [bacterium]|nr:DUF89 family protein [bacterium]